ncbi:MAG: glycosyltransferase family 4 protein [Isosphaeraceae bacterium]
MPDETEGGVRLQRVLYAIAMNPDRFASMEEQIFLITRAIQERGGLFLPLWICGHRTGNPPVYEAAGLRAECLDLHHFRLRTLVHLVRLIHHHRIELIHWSFTQPTTNPYLWALSVLTPRVRHYFTDHTSRGLPLAPPARGVKRAVKELLYRRYARVLGVSRYVTDHLRDQGCTADLSTCRYFLNTERFQPDPAMRAAVRQEILPGGSDHFVVVVVAYLVPAKGVDVAIRAIAQLPDPVKLWIVGGGPESARLQELCRELGVADRVRFFGHQADVQRYLQGADCFVCPSRWGEAAGIVNLEAQACALPVLGSRIGGIPEYIQDGRTGFLFSPEDDRELAGKIRLLYEDSALRQEMQRAARTWTVEDFSPENRLEAFLELYRVPR